MIGQGRPKASRARIAPIAWAAPWLCRAALACLSCFLFLAQVHAEETSLQLRIAWGGGSERIWEGSIRVPGGRFSDLQTLGIESDEPGSIWLDNDRIEIRQRTLRAYDGVDVMVVGDADARIVISLADDQGEAAKPVPLFNGR